MRSRRAPTFLLVAVLLLGGACAQGDPDVEAQGTDEPSATQDDARSEECMEGTEEDLPSIDWQNTTVDIEPASRYGNDADIAYVTTTVATSEEDADAVRRELEQIDGATVEEAEDGTLFTVRQQMDVEPESDEEFKFSMAAPLEGTQLAKNGDISVVVQLPRASRDKENGPNFEVELVSASSEDENVPEPTIHDGEENPLVGERITASWHWCVDPYLDVVYKIVGGG